MLDSTPIIPTMTEAWRYHVSYGEIVSFQFPFAEMDAAGRSKLGPAYSSISTRGAASASPLSPTAPRRGEARTSTTRCTSVAAPITSRPA